MILNNNFQQLPRDIFYEPTQQELNFAGIDACLTFL